MNEWMPVNPCSEDGCDNCPHQQYSESCMANEFYLARKDAQKKLLEYLATRIELSYAKYLERGLPTLLNDLKEMLKELEASNG